jgi:putative hemolysin
MGTITQVENKKYIDIKKVLAEKAPSTSKWIPGFLIRYLEHILHQDEINCILNRYHDYEGVDFMRQLVSCFDIHFELTGMDALPSGGRYIFASNHPLGGLDGICLSALLGERYNGNIKYPVNDLLLFIPNLRSLFIPVNKHGKQSKENALMTDEAYASDNQIITFPAGLCSRKMNGKVVDLEWKKSFIQKAVEYKRDVIPVYFEGRNSNFFYNLARLRVASGIRFNIEMMYLSDEMFKSQHTTYRIIFGKPIPWQTFDKRKKPVEWAQWVKEITYNMCTIAE